MGTPKQIQNEPIKSQKKQESKTKLTLLCAVLFIIACLSIIYATNSVSKSMEIDNDIPLFNSPNHAFITEKEREKIAFNEAKSKSLQDIIDSADRN